MKNAVKKTRELIAELESNGKLSELGEDELAALLQNILSGFDENDFSAVHRSVKPFQSHIDRVGLRGVRRRTRQGSTLQLGLTIVLPGAQDV